VTSAFLYALVVVLQAGSNQRVKWCADRIARTMRITIKHPRQTGLWTREIQSADTIRRIYADAKKRVACDPSETGFRLSCAKCISSLIWWAETNVKPSWGWLSYVPPGINVVVQFDKPGGSATAQTLVKGALRFKLECKTVSGN
jgi:hypothetical protein